MKAGGAYIPLDPLYPQDRIEFMLEDASAERARHARERCRERSRRADPSVVVFDRWDALDAESAENPPTMRALDDLAYVIYTSGLDRPAEGRDDRATGASSSAFLAYDAGLPADASTTCHLQMASFSFDVFTGDLIRSLLVGREARALPARGRDRPAAPLRADGRARASTAPSSCLRPPTLLFEYVESAGRTLDFMRVIVVSSEGWRTEQVRSTSSASAGRRTRLINAYGLTEATIDST